MKLKILTRDAVCPRLQSAEWREVQKRGVGATGSRTETAKRFQEHTAGTGMGDPRMNHYTYARRPESDDAGILANLDRRFGGFQAVIELDPAKVQAAPPPEPKPEFDGNGRPLSQMVVTSWPPDAHYKPAKKVLGQQVVKTPNYGTVPCKHCGANIRKRSRKHEYCTKGGCQNESRKNAQEKLNTSRRKYRAAHPDCPHPETASAGPGRRVCTLCDVKFKEPE